MNPIAIAEYVSAIFVAISSIGLFSNKDKTKVSEWLKHGCAAEFLYLLIDASAYTFTGAQYPFAFRYVLNLFAYTFGSVVIFFFLNYSDAYIGERTKLKPWVFMIPKVLTLIFYVIAIIFFLAGKLVVYENGIAVEVNDYPIFLRIIQIIAMVYTPAVAFIKVKSIGLKAALLLGLYNLVPIIASLITIITKVDVSVVLAAVSFILVSTILQNDIFHEHLQEKQKQLEEALSMAQSASKAKTEFLFNMSHDIRTPMNAILGYTDIALNHTNEPQRVSDSLKKIKSSGAHLLKLINDILEMSRIEAGKMELDNEPLNAYDVTEGIDNMGKALAATKDIEFKTTIGEMKNPYVYSDELHTNQILINLISNAIKYTNPGGKVEYSISQISEPIDKIARYRLEIKDNGIGMSEEFQQHLFESFSRENDVNVSKEEGSGLGLAIVKRIVDLIGGTIEVHSAKGEGSTFIVELPLEVMDEKAIEEYEKKRISDSITFGNDYNLEGKRILLVEDNEMNREIASEILTEAGLAVETAEDGSIAVDRIREKGSDFYDFILMDIQMPIMNGYEATKEIRKLPKGDEIPIIALSANAFEEDRKKSLDCGMNAHIAKPIDIRELLGTMHSLKR